MTPEDVIDVLAKASAFDQRTVGEADVLAWQEILHRYELPDALSAVTRHSTETRDRLMPSDLVRHIRTVRDDRKRLEAKHQVRELPSRYEDDITRDIRMERGLAECKHVLALIADQLAKRRQPPSDELRESA